MTDHRQLAVDLFNHPPDWIGPVIWAAVIVSLLGITLFQWHPTAFGLIRRIASAIAIVPIVTITSLGCIIVGCVWAFYGDDPIPSGVDMDWDTTARVFARGRGNPVRGTIAVLLVKFFPYMLIVIGIGGLAGACCAMRRLFRANRSDDS